MPRSPVEMAAAMIANMPERTGNSLAQWLKLTTKQASAKHSEIVKWLKAEHGLTQGFANLIAHETLNARSGAAPASGDELVQAQYAGPKAELRPIYDAILAAVCKLGKDVEVAPKKAYVSLRRSKQFAIVQPSTRTRIDLGIKLTGKEPEGRLEASGSWNAMVTHRVRLESKADFDAAVKRWLKQAYAQA